MNNVQFNHIFASALNELKIDKNPKAKPFYLKTNRNIGYEIIKKNVKQNLALIKTREHNIKMINHSNVRCRSSKITFQI